MKPLVVLLSAALVIACTPAETPASPTPPPEPPPAATLPPPAVGTPPPATPAPEPAPEATPDVPATGLEAELQDLLDGWREGEAAPGGALGVRLADGTTHIVVSGETDDTGGAPIQREDRFRIGSITKTFVAVLLVRLAEEGLLHLDDRLADHLPDAPHADRVTIRQLLDHTSGMPDFGAVTAYRQQLLANPARAWDAEATVALVADRELEFEPGTGWAYSNTNYSLAGMVAEAVTGQPLAELLRQWISEPLGLESTFLEGLEEAPPVETAGHYDIDGDGRPENVRVIPYTALVTSGAAAGGLSSAAGDVLNFASGVFDGTLLSPDGLTQLTEPSPAYAGYALGLAVFERDGRQFWGHAGALPGYTALLAHVREEGISVVALANQSGVDALALVEEAFRLAQQGTAAAY